MSPQFPKPRSTSVWRSFLIATPFCLLGFYAQGATGWTYVPGSGPAGAGISSTANWVAPSNNFTYTAQLSSNPLAPVQNPNIVGYTGTFDTSSFTYGDSSLSGPYSGPGYSGQDAFFNQFTGGATNPHLQISVDIVGDPSAVRFTGDPNTRFNGGIQVFQGNAVESIKITYDYLGIPNYYSPGWTGRVIAGTAFETRPLIHAAPSRNNTTITLGDLREHIAFPTAPTIGNAFSVNEFYGNAAGNGNAAGQQANRFGTTRASIGPFDNKLPTFGAGGTTASISGNDALTWHNEGELGELVQTFSLTWEPTTATYFTNNTTLTFSLDGMAAIIPEPSRGLLLLTSLSVLLLRRRR